ncbi:MAG: hypothetical protein IJA98_10635 [Bacteroidaceae bacterium]|nr:hypothetical protein [Bacteroidaceae bacterium]MBQ3239499.1 hypothetical protein [Bacteroidaceae bacterium]
MLKEISYEYNFPNFSFMSRFFRRHVRLTYPTLRQVYALIRWKRKTVAPKRG